MNWGTYFAFAEEEWEELVHAIIPTRLVWKRTATQTPANNNERIAFYAAKTNVCCVCGQSVIDVVSFVALRVFIVHSSGRARTTCASVCTKCVPYPEEGHMHAIQIGSIAGLNALVECAKKILNAGRYTCLGLLDYAEALNKRTPWVLRHLSKALEKACNYCTAAAAADVPLKRCSRCNYIRYCSEECSRAGWPLHKTECNIISKGDLLFDVSFRLILINSP